MVIKRGSKRVYEFHELEVGDVFTMPMHDTVFMKTEDSDAIDLSQGWWRSVDGNASCTKVHCELVVYD